MYDSYLTSIQDKEDKYIQYAEALINYLQSSMDKDRPIYATHGHCTDGGVAGAMVRYSIPEAAIIPIDYWMINDPNFEPILEAIPWKGIIDLKPFNSNPMDFWVDHHISARDATPNANRIRFDMDGDSGSYQLLLSEFIGPFPEHMVELAVMTRITDTASYITEPPTEIITNITELNQTETHGEEGRIQNEKRIWLLDDAWGSTYSLKEHLNLHNYLAKDGFSGIQKILPRINLLREGRKEAYQIADSIDIVDVVAFSFDQDSQDKFTILHRLQKNGVKVAISMSKTKEGTVKLSFRRNRHIETDLANKIQVHSIAGELNGGGHPGAAGAAAEDLATALDKIETWVKSLGLSFSHVEL